jgi:hypothetical protein
LEPATISSIEFVAEIISEATFAPRMLLRSRYAVTEVGWFPQNQFMTIIVVDADGFPLGGPGWNLSAETFNLTTDGCVPLATKIEIPFTWSIEEIRGFFIGPAEIPAGTEELGLSINGTDATGAAVSTNTKAATTGSASVTNKGNTASITTTATRSSVKAERGGRRRGRGDLRGQRLAQGRGAGA